MASFALHLGLTAVRERYRMGKRRLIVSHFREYRQGVEKLVDLVGIEPTTSPAKSRGALRPVSSTFRLIPESNDAISNS